MSRSEIANHSPNNKGGSRANFTPEELFQGPTLPPSGGPLPGPRKSPQNRGVPREANQPPARVITPSEDRSYGSLASAAQSRRRHARSPRPLLLSPPFFSSPVHTTALASAQHALAVAPPGRLLSFPIMFQA